MTDRCGTSILEYLLESGDWGEFEGDIRRLESWRYGDMFRAMLHGLDRAVLFKSPVHGEGHIERVMLHGAISAMENDLDGDDTRLLLLMCSYHDTGRISDWLDDMHGARSAHKIEAITGLEGEDLKIAMAGVEAHSLKDVLMDDVIDRYAVKDRDRCRMLAQLLKDADGLDRVRINDLDVSFLRNGYSKKRRPFAEHLYRIYLEEQVKRGIPAPKKGEYFNKELLKNVRDSLNRLYFDRDYNCAMATICVLAELLDTRINDQTIQAALCMNGAGRYRAQCGLVEGALMFMGIYYSEKGLSRDVITPICHGFAEKFEKQYGSLMCRDLRPGGFRETDPPHMCAGLSLDTVLFTYEYIVTKNKELAI